jgi:hypothetical protein
MVHFNKSSSIKDSEESEESGEIKEPGNGNGNTKNEMKKQNMLHVIKKNVNHTFTTSIIVNYLYQILEKFGKNNMTNSDLLLRRYLNDVFIEIVDIWGFINTYYPLLEYCYDHSYSLSSKMTQFFDKLKYIFKEYLYKPRVEKINIGDLVNDLKELNGYF